MNPDNEQLVRESWEWVRPLAPQLATTFYEHLFRANPELSKLFESTDMHEQRKKFIVMLSEIVRVLDRPELLIGEVADSGRRHMSYGVRDRDYEDVGAALLAALGEVLAGRFTPEIRDAWREAYTLLAAVMRRATARTSSPGMPASA